MHKAYRISATRVQTSRTGFYFPTDRSCDRIQRESRYDLRSTVNRRNRTYANNANSRVVGLVRVIVQKEKLAPFMQS